MTEPEIVEQSEPDAVFTLLSDDIRVEILQALWDTDGRLSFSEIRDAVGIRDSGQFNYHLDKLTGRFVRKTEDGYELTQAGQHINGAIASGAFTMEASMEPITLDSPCSTCGGTQSLTYEDETVTVECDSCPVSAHFPFPPGIFAGHEREQIPEVASDYLRSTMNWIDAGFCPYCDGKMVPSVAPLTDPDDPDEAFAEELAESLDIDPTTIPWIDYSCQRCGAASSASLHLALVNHPAVAGFHFDHAIDLSEKSLWEFPIMDDETVTIEETDPFRASVTYTAGDESLTIVVDDEMTVQEIDRTSI